MGTPQSGQRADAGFDRRLLKIEDNIRQLRERFARPQKIPAAATGSVSMTVAKCSAPDNPQISGSLRYYTANGWTFSANESGEDGPTLTNDPDDTRAFLVSEAGWYMIRWRNELTFNNADTPPGFVDFNIARANEFNDFIKTEAVTAGASGSPTIPATFSGVFLDWTIGPCYLAASESVYMRARYTGTAPVAFDGAGLIVEVSKLG